MFMDPGRTSYDLNFRLGDIPVRVHPWFWLMALILGSESLRLGLEYVVAWVACVFVSILIHELGHVLAGRMFGTHGEIILYGLGGLAVSASQLPNRWKRIAVYFAGPLAGFLFLGLVLLCMPLIAPVEWVVLKATIRDLLGLPVQELELIARISRLKFHIFADLFFINLVWGLVNLVPIWPLDGGRISSDFLDWLMPRNGMSVALGISLVLAGLLAVNSLMVEMKVRPLFPFLPIGGWWSALMFGALAFYSFQALQQVQARRRWVDDHAVRWDGDDDKYQRW
jgi:Zn-dependent protease